MVLRKVLQLDVTACPASASVGSIELEHAVCPAVRAYRILHRLVLLHAAFRHLKPEFQYLTYLSSGLPDQ